LAMLTYTRSMPILGRFAPSPTGTLHLGNLRTALASWLSARAQGGRWLIRIEDVDTTRCRPELAEAQVRDLAALGMESDLPLMWQSQRGAAYEAALRQLHSKGCLYPCACTRKDLAALASAPHASDGLRPYPGTCRERRRDPWLPDAWRLALPEGEVPWEDQLLGPQVDHPRHLTGDPLLHRRDGCFAYHLAVVVDDGAQGVTEVVRGMDLREVTATQIRLQQALGLPCPQYAHLGLVTAPDGGRLGKRDGALGLAALASLGISSAQLLGWLGWSLGCLAHPEPCAIQELIPGFHWSRVPKGPLALPEDWA